MVSLVKSCGIWQLNKISTFTNSDVGGGLLALMSIVTKLILSGLILEWIFLKYMSRLMSSLRP